MADSELKEKKVVTKKKFIISLILAIVISGTVTGLVVWAATGGYSVFMPPSVATLSQDQSRYGENEKNVLDVSKRFWTAMENADENGMREIADERCVFVHIGMTCNLDDEIAAYTSGMFSPTSIVFHGKNVNVFNYTAIVITDCDYSLKLGGISTTHHFAVTEAYAFESGAWRLVQFSFTALTH